MGKICKGTALILMVLGIIGILYISGILGEGLGAAFFLYGLFSVLIFCMCLYALGEIVDKLTEIAENAKTDKKDIIKNMFPEGIMDIQKRSK